MQRSIRNFETPTCGATVQPRRRISQVTAFSKGESAPPIAESARGISPRAAHRSGLDTLASSGSCHRNEGCRLPPKIGAHPVASWLTPDVGDLPPLLHGHYPASSLLRSSPPLTGASVLSASRFRPLAPFPLASSARFSSSVRKPE